MYLLLSLVLFFSYVNAHMWLRTPLSVGGVDYIGGTTSPCNGLTLVGTPTVYEQGQNVTFQFRVNQHGSDPFAFKVSTNGATTFTYTLANNIQNNVVAGPDGFQGVNVPVSIPNVLCTNCVVQLSGMGTNGVNTWYNCALINIVTPGSLGICFPSSVQPNQGPTAGGTTVYVMGTDFGNSSTANPNLACKFDFTVVPATWMSPTQVQCVTPPKNTPADSVLEVTLDGIHFSNTGTIFSYIGGIIQPVVQSISPTSGAPGTNITITGQYYYSPAMLCKFNNTVVSAEWISETEAQCTVPNLKGSGYVPFEVNVDGSIYSQSGLRFDLTGAAAALFNSYSLSRALALALILILGALFA